MISFNKNINSKIDNTVLLYIINTTKNNIEMMSVNLFDNLYGNILSNNIFKSLPPSRGSIGKKLNDINIIFILLIILKTLSVIKLLL